MKKFGISLYHTLFFEYNNPHLPKKKKKKGSDEET